VSEEEQQELDKRVEALGNAPLDPEKNAKYRERIRALGDSDDLWAKAIWRKCENDPVYWFNTFVWTQNPKDVGSHIEGVAPDVLLTPELVKTLPDKIEVRTGFVEVPMILFPRQQEFIRTLDLHVEFNRPLLLEKTREQGASVLMANYCGWRWTFKDNANIKVGSMKEELVDGDSFADQILPKLDFALEKMPHWIKPPGYTGQKPHRTFMKRKNPATGRVIKGEATNKHFGVSGRYAMVFLDEVSKIEDLPSIHRKVANTTNCFVYCTTPEGYETFADMRHSGEFPVFDLHWTKNRIWLPKGYTLDQCTWEPPLKKQWPEEWLCKPGCKAHREGGMPHSERYDLECQKLGWNEKDIAQELDISYLKSGANVFDVVKVMRAIDWLKKNPQEFQYYKLDFDKPANALIPAADDGEEEAWYYTARNWRVKGEPTTGGALRIYKLPFSCRDKACACRGTGIHTYVFGGDTCKNVDGDFDAGYVYDLTAGEIVAEWHGRTKARTLGKEWAKLCKFYGSSSVPFVPDAWAAPEWNEFGQVACDVMDMLGILLHVSRSEDKIRKNKGPYLGVVIQPNNKGRLIHNYLVPEVDGDDEDNPEMPRLFCPFVEFWEEAKTYVYKYSESTNIKPEKAKMGAQMRKQKDDRVSAMLCTIYGARLRYPSIKGYVDETLIQQASCVGYQTVRRDRECAPV
jgi:hypothetical protein